MFIGENIFIIMDKNTEKKPNNAYNDGIKQ